MDDDRLHAAAVPDALRPLFAKAERTVQQYFRGLRRRPDRGTIAVDEQRYLLVRTSALSVEFFDMVSSRFPSERRQDAAALARSLLFDLAHSAGLTDARVFAERMGLTDPLERLSAGPLHFALAGWAFVEMLPECNPDASDAFMLVYDHPYSFEAAAWMAAGRTPDRPCCIMNAGYSSGRCEESFGITLLAAEVTCQALGHEQCRFVMAPPERLAEAIASYVEAHPELGVSASSVELPTFLDAASRMGELEVLTEQLTAANAALEARVRSRTNELSQLNDRLARELEARKAEEAHRLAVETRLQESQRLESLGLLAGGVAHDFNNLLATILGSAELIRLRLSQGKDVEPLLERLEEASEQAAGLTRQLLALAGRTQSRMQPVDLEGLLEDLLALLRASVSKNTRLVLSVEPDVICTGDPAQLRQLFMNLVLNGAEAVGRRRGRVEVRLYRDTLSEGELAGLRLPGEAKPGAFVVAEVKDTGVGMSAEVLARVFDPFFTTKAMGRGLGLASLRTILRAHRGALHVESDPGEGSLFTVYLPLSELGVAEEEVPEARTPLRGEVLVVDDEEDVRATTAELLESLGLTVRTARDGAAAIQAVNKRRPDAVVLDVTMAGMDGWETLAALRQLHPLLPVLMCSGYDRFAHAPVDVPLLAKPFTQQALYEALEPLMSAAVGAGTAPAR